MPIEHIHAKISLFTQPHSSVPFILNTEAGVLLPPYPQETNLYFWLDQGVNFPAQDLLRSFAPSTLLTQLSLINTNCLAKVIVVSSSQIYLL